MTVTAPDPEDAALKAALAGFSAKQIQNALTLIASGRYRQYAPAERGTRTWVMQSGSRAGTTYIVVDDGGDHQFCNCPFGSHGRRCYHMAAAIMLRIHAEHEHVHRLWCPGSDAKATARASDPVCCDLDVRGDANTYDPFAVFDRL